MFSTLSIVLAGVSVVLPAISIIFIIYQAIRSFSLMLTIACLSGTIIIESISIVDMLIVLDLYQDSPVLLIFYFMATSFTSILSCYVLLKVGTNLYQEYNSIKSFLIFGPIALTFFVFALTIYTTIQFILKDQKVVDPTLEITTMSLSIAAGVLSLLFSFGPLISIRKQTRLKPEKTATSILQLFMVVLFFIAHYVVYILITLKIQIFSDSNVRMDSIHNIISILIFPGCLISPPRKILKKVKRKMLGVEELTIGGDYRVSALLDNNNLEPPSFTYPTRQLNINSDSIIISNYDYDQFTDANNLTSLPIIVTQSNNNDDDNKSPNSSSPLPQRNKNNFNSNVNDSSSLVTIPPNTRSRSDTIETDSSNNDSSSIVPFVN
ncbi:13019_t:CDS:1 [Entrophospora sp. SA101]|nr:9001_t:CDS:1 [Entrophospora sp. SA101]CAJ0873368.1 13019_t:CDS:1 [Entrophospora sp. SA101]